MTAPDFSDVPEAHTPRATTLPWHPLLFGAVIAATAWLDAAVSPYAAARSLVIALIIAAALTALAALALRSVQVGTVIASGVIWALWSKALIDVPRAVVDRLGAAGAAVVAMVLVAIVILLVRLIARSTRAMTMDGLTTILNRAAGLLLVVTLGTGFVNGRLIGSVEDLDQGTDLAGWQARASDGGAAGPDIYAILLDGYPRADVLGYAFGIDNRPLTEALEARDFSVADASHSDYLWTHVSLPSILNMAYVEQISPLLDVMEGRLSRQPALRRTVTNNLVFEYARSEGYTTIGVGAGYEEVSTRRADVYLDGGQLNEFEISLLVSTWLGDVIAALAPDFASAQQRDRIEYNLEVLADVAATPDRGPVLVFAHVPAPHQPAVFGDDGAPVAVPLSDSYFADSPIERGENPEDFKERYRAQLPYLNERIIEAVDEIVRHSDEPPIIVLFADHGSASAIDWNATDPGDADPARLLERTGILFAALTPGRADVYPDDVSPVDLFRLIFDAYLGTDYGRAVPPDGGGQIAPVDASVFDEGT